MNVDPSSNTLRKSIYFLTAAASGDKHLLGVSYLSGIILGDVMCNESLCIGLTFHLQVKKSNSNRLQQNDIYWLSNW